MARRLPVYLLIDCSGSMRGDPIEAVRVGVDSLVYALTQDPVAFTSAYLSVITFSGRVETLVQLTPIADFKAPELKIDPQTPGTSLGQALALLEERTKQEVLKKSATEQGDYLPLVFILTDGKPSDTAAYNAMAERIRNGEILELRSRNIIACAAGAMANAEVLRKVADDVLVLSNVSRQEIEKYFKFASMMTSSRLENNGPARQSVSSVAKNLGMQTIGLSN